MKNWVKGLLILVALTILSVSIIFLVREIGNLKKLNKELVDDKVSLYEEVGKLRISRDSIYKVTDSLKLESHYLGKLLEEKDLEIARLRDSLAKIPEAIEELEPEESYEWVQLRYPDESEKPYDFSEIQVKSIHIDLASYDLLLGINKELVDANSILSNKLILEKAQKQGLEEIIDSYREENTQLYKTIDGLREGTTKVKIQRNVLVVILVATGTVLGTLIAL
jgi:hypothetical protein